MGAESAASWETEKGAGAEGSAPAARPLVDADGLAQLTGVGLRGRVPLVVGQLQVAHGRAVLVSPC